MDAAEEAAARPRQQAHPNLLGLKITIDNHMLDKGRAAGGVLRLAEENGWVRFQVVEDTLIDEINSATNPAVRAHKSDLAAGKPIVAGPFTLDLSLLDGPAVLVADDDDYQELVERVHAVLWPASSWQLDVERHVVHRKNKARQRLQDSRYVATSIRFGMDAFITGVLPADDRAASSHASISKGWSRLSDSNRRPSHYE